jgi:transporter family protein
MLSLKDSWEFWALSAGLFAALTAIFIKVGIQNINADYAVFIRTLIILPLIAAFLIFTDQWQSPASWSSRTWLFLALSAIATTASWISYFRALKLGPVSQVAPIEKISLVLVAVFGLMFLNEELSRQNWLGIVLVLIGVILIGR